VRGDRRLRSGPAERQESESVAVEKPAPGGPITFNDFSMEDFTDYSPTSFVLHLSGKLDPQVNGTELQWAIRSDIGPMGSGTSPLEIAGDRTFKAALSITFAKTLDDLAPYAKTDDVDIAIDVDIGGTKATASGHMRSPHLPEPKMLTVQATRSGEDTIDLTYNFAINNSNLFPLKYNGFDYKAYLSGKLIAEDNVASSTALLKQSAQTEFGLNKEANAENCGKDIKTMEKQSRLPWSFTGVAHYEGLDVPFALSGELSLARE
jgi:LEA14-like dessication related protein